MTPELQNRLSDLAAKLGVSVEHLWGVLVRQAALHGVYDLMTAAGLLLAMAAVAAGYVVLWRWPAPKKAELFDPTPLNRAAGAAVAAMLLLVFGSAFIGAVYDALTDFGNPEFYAFKHLPFTQ
jgi:hypothetical protein